MESVLKTTTFYFEPSKAPSLNTYPVINNITIDKREFGLVKPFDAEDSHVDTPDGKSIITYVVTYYHYFSKLKQETTQGKRIAKVLNIQMEIEKMINDYETFTSDLLAWIEDVIRVLGNRKFANSLRGVQEQLGQFNA